MNIFMFQIALMFTVVGVSLALKYSKRMFRHLCDFSLKLVSSDVDTAMQNLREMFDFLSTLK